MWDSAKNKPWSERRETQAVRQTSAFVLSMWDKAQLMLLLSNMLYALAMLLLLYAVLFLLVHLPIFPLRHVDIKGELGHVTREQVQFVVTREFKGNFFTLDLNQARHWRPWWGC